MDARDAEYRDVVVPANIVFGRHGDGAFQFGTVRGWMDYRIVVRDDLPTAEFSWQGSSDMDEACGRGWASLVERTLRGHLFIHNGDDSSFTAEVSAETAARRKREGAGRLRGTRGGSSSSSR